MKKMDIAAFELVFTAITWEPPEFLTDYQVTVRAHTGDAVVFMQACCATGSLDVDFSLTPAELVARLEARALKLMADRDRNHAQAARLAEAKDRALGIDRAAREFEAAVARIHAALQTATATATTRRDPPCSS